ncbi:MAG: M20/M25/M40 family metallo-hydrolase [Pseudomonadota bacterium]
MYIVNSKKIPEIDVFVDRINVSEDYLKYIVESISMPRHYIAERHNNSVVREWIKNEFDSLGLISSCQGNYKNIISRYEDSPTDFSIIVGAHYDSVPNSPGADDNASAIAAMLAIAKALKEYDKLPVLFIAFNREEDNLLGSREFVSSLLKEQTRKIKCAHVLEMVGYCSSEPKSQLVPPGLPIKISDVGDFIGVIANRYSNNLVKQIIYTAEKYVPSLPVTALKVFLGMEKIFPHLLRSDHAPFWERKIPALMWTDTSEFRNPNYHKSTDTPDTLDYSFLCKVVQLLGNCIIEQVNVSEG